VPLAAFAVLQISTSTIFILSVKTNEVRLIFLFHSFIYLWSPYVIGRPYIFSSCDFYLSFFFLSFFSSPNLSGRRLDVYHTSTHGVALVRI